MKTITVNKHDLLKALQENREQHKRKFYDAYRGFIEAAKKRLQYQLDRINEGNHPNLRSVWLEPPSDHTEDYDRVIQMLQMDVVDHVELTQQEFQQYVQDDWSWKQAWLQNTSTYTEIE